MVIQQMQPQRQGRPQAERLLYSRRQHCRALLPNEHSPNKEIVVFATPAGNGNRRLRVERTRYCEPICEWDSLPSVLLPGCGKRPESISNYQLRDNCLRSRYSVQYCKWTILRHTDCSWYIQR